MNEGQIFLEDTDSDKVVVGIRKNENLTQISMKTVRQYLDDFQPYFSAKNDKSQPLLSSPAVLNGLLKIRELYEKGWSRDEILFALLNSIRAGKDNATADIRMEPPMEKRIA